MKLSVVARQMRMRFDQSAVRMGVTRAQWTVFAVVSRHPGSTQKIIAEYLDITEASAGRLIDKMCADGLLERRARAEDRRAYSVFVTDAAAGLLESLSGVARQNEETAFAGLTDVQITELTAMLNIIYANIGPQNSLP